MTTAAAEVRVLVIDDNPSIHDDFQKILADPSAHPGYLAARAVLLGVTARPEPAPPRFRLDCVTSGREGLRRLEQGLADHDPFALAFVDMRMPAGWDGVETIERLWAAQPTLEVVVCTAFSDQNWREIVGRLGRRDNLLVLRKPFDPIEVERMAEALARKAALAREARERIARLDDLVAIRSVELSRRREILDGIIRVASDGILTVSPDGVVIEANPAAERIFCGPSATLAGQPLEQLLQVEDFVATGDSLAERLARLNQPVEGNGQPACGEAVPLEVRAAALPLPIAEDAGFTVFCRDLSEAVEGERARASLEAQLRQAQKMEAIGRLAGGVAHDFNNLLAVILGSASLLGSDHNLREDQVEVINEIITAADRAAAMTRQLLTFSRQHVTQPKVVNPDHLLEEIAPMLGRLLGGLVSVQLTAASEGTRIRIDRGQFTQVVLNLVVNARDAMPDGGRLLVELRRAPEPPAGRAAPGESPREVRDGVQLEVRDTGYGMSAGLVDRIFEPFFTTKGIGHGSGLGLAVVHGIVTEADGHLSVESQLGVGTTMRVWFPACPEGATDGIESVCGHPTVPPSRILLVEDEELIRVTVARLLRRAGHEVLVAVDGDEALAVLDATDRQIDLMVTDLAMPGMNGLELAEAVQQRHPLVRVLYTSGHAADSIGIGAALARDAAFLPKPYTIHDLGKALHTVLSAPAPVA